MWPPVMSSDTLNLRTGVRLCTEQLPNRHSFHFNSEMRMSVSETGQSKHSETFSELRMSVLK